MSVVSVKFYDLVIILFGISRNVTRKLYAAQMAFIYIYIP